MHYILIIFGTCLLTNSLCQSISGQIIDESTGEALQYVNVRVVNKNLGTVSTKDGKFQLSTSNVSKDDTVRFSYVGYATLSLTVNSYNASKDRTIKLKPKPVILHEVAVKSEAKTRILGNPNSHRRYTGWGDFQSLRGRIRGLLIDGAACPVKVKSISFRINHNEWDSVAFRINLLEVKDNKAGNSILTENIFVTTDKKHQWVRVDLHKRNISICGKTIVTFEWIDAWGSIGEHSNLLTISLGKNAGFMYSQEPGEELGTLSMQENPPAIILEVYED